MTAITPTGLVALHIIHTQMPEIKGEREISRKAAKKRKEIQEALSPLRTSRLCVKINCRSRMTALTPTGLVALHIIHTQMPEIKGEREISRKAAKKRKEIQEALSPLRTSRLCVKINCRSRMTALTPTGLVPLS